MSAVHDALAREQRALHWCVDVKPTPERNDAVACGDDPRRNAECQRAHDPYVELLAPEQVLPAEARCERRAKPLAERDQLGTRGRRTTATNYQRTPSVGNDADGFVERRLVDASCE